MPKADVILQQLNAEYRRSKVEQIQQFLRDQHDLSQTLSNYALDTDDDNESDCSETETVFEMRMAAYKVRPQSAFTETRGTDVVKNCDTQVFTAVKVTDIPTSRRNEDAIIRSDATKQSVATKTRHNAVGEVATLHKLKKRDPQQTEGSRKKHDVTSGDDALRGRSNCSRPPTKCRGRPNTATGVGRVKGESTYNHAQETNTPIADGTSAKTKQRSSAPAVVSRTRQLTWDTDIMKDHVLEKYANLTKRTTLNDGQVSNERKGHAVDRQSCSKNNDRLVLSRFELSNSRKSNIRNSVGEKQDSRSDALRKDSDMSKFATGLKLPALLGDTAVNRH